MTEPTRIEPAHVIMLKAALATRPSIGGRLDGPDWFTASRSHPEWALKSWHVPRLKFWNRITQAARDFADTARLPLGVVLLALGKL